MASKSTPTKFGIIEACSDAVISSPVIIPTTQRALSALFGFIAFVFFVSLFIASIENHNRPNFVDNDVISFP